MVFAEVEGGGADKVADVLDIEKVEIAEVESFRRVPHHVRVEVAPRSRVHLLYRHPGRRDPDGIIVGLLVPFDDRLAELPAKFAQSPLEEGRLAGAGRAHQIEDEDSAIAEDVPVRRGEPGVLREDILLNRDLFPRAVVTGPAMLMVVMVIMPVAVVIVVMMVMMVVRMVVTVVIVMVMIVGGTAAAGGAHGQSTSSSFTRISSPAVSSTL